MMKFFEPVLAVSLGLALGLGVAGFAGEDPSLVLRVIFNSAFGTGYNLGMTLFYTTCLSLTGLSVAVAFRAGLFNIGAEGQLLWGALAVAAVGIYFPGLPAPFAVLISLVVSGSAGAFWAWIAGWLRAKRGSHEVITTIMLNFVAAAGTSYFTLYVLKNPDVQNPETMPVAPSYLLAPWEVFQGAPLGSALLGVLLVLVAYQVLMDRSVMGFELKAVGQSEKAARIAGVSVEKVQISAMAWAGCCAGWVGVVEVLGNSGKFRPSFSPDYGFMGIAVALLGRGHALGIFLSAFLFAALHKGSVDLDFESEIVTRDISKVIQACVIFVVCADGIWARWRKGQK
jgi:simple sugar transport system permease protein